MSNNANLKKNIETEKKKDFWDKLAIFGSITLPIIVAIGGWIVSGQLNDQNTNIKEQNEEFSRIIDLQNLELAKLSANQSQAGTVKLFFEDLLHKDAKRKNLAIAAIKLALPEKWPSLIKAAGENDDEIREVSEKLLAANLTPFIDQLFSHLASDRKSAYLALLGGWGDDFTLVPELLRIAKEKQAIIKTDKKAIENGIFNTLVLLSHVDQSLRNKYASEISDFSKSVEKNGEKTKARAEKLRSRL